MFSFVTRRFFPTAAKVQKLLQLQGNSNTIGIYHSFSSKKIVSLTTSKYFQIHKQRSTVCWNQTQLFHESFQKRKTKEEPENRELDLMRYDFKEIKSTPKPAIYLGCAGLIPFIAAPLIMAVTETYFPEVAFAQITYGASILSFLGGIRWGFAVPENSPAKPDWLNLGNSVILPLLAWIALVFNNLTESAVMVIMGLGVALHYDLSLLPSYPSWFKALRTILTVVATFSLVATMMIKSAYPEKRLKSNDKGNQNF
ncbi:transmembrane protein 69 [Callorhinchus milii]|uniref:Transmembrane protein 69 n=1 Tax=Callorhinchus milii TaxID=7868 RepID=A0A4W3I6E1_CALMI|nr:transmembrane protein 69 [Callorhinchus milii]|eukprot:gi/632963763/ref/XP_007898066.1/ PREDICTED: transmembrane protein 69 [Callorhinchus milii]